MSVHNKNKNLLKGFREALYNFDQKALHTQINSVFADDALVQLCYPFETLENPNALIEQAYLPLSKAFVGLEPPRYNCYGWQLN
ncbi:hypothetical protein ACOBV9_06280 [Pseudoalteromonas espejiana]